MIRFATPGEVNGCESPDDLDYLADSASVSTAVADDCDASAARREIESPQFNGRTATNLNRENADAAQFEERVALLEEPAADPLLESYLDSAAAADWARYGCWPLEEREAAVINALIYAHRWRKWKAIRGWVGGFALLAIGSLSAAGYLAWEALPGQTELFWQAVGWQEWATGQINLYL